MIKEANMKMTFKGKETVTVDVPDACPNCGAPLIGRWDEERWEYECGKIMNVNGGATSSDACDYIKRLRGGKI